VKYAAPIGENCFWPESMKGEAAEITYMCVRGRRANVLSKLGGSVLSGFIWLEIRTVPRLLRTVSASVRGRDCDWLISISF
jgi:hypothetical protein